MAPCLRVPLGVDLCVCINVRTSTTTELIEMLYSHTCVVQKAILIALNKQVAKMVCTVGGAE